jgi:MFS transporter, DHA1 family, inner membrane transport protein
MRAALIVAMVFCAGLGAAAQFGKISVTFQQLQGVYAGHGPVAIGWMVSIVGTVGLILGVIAGRLVPGLGAGRAMVAALVAGALVSAAQGAMPPYPVMMALRVVEGLSHLAIVVTGPVLMAAQATPRTQGFVMALWGSFFGLAYAILAQVAPGITGWGGIGALFAAHGAWLAVCAGALWVLLPRDARAPVRIGNPVALHITAYRSPWIAAPALGFVCYTILFVALLTILPPLVPAPWGGVVATAMPLTAIVLSLTLGVWMQARMSAVRVVQWGFVVAALSAVVLWAVWDNGPGMTAAALAMTAGFALVQGASFAAIAELNASDADRALAAGVIAQMGNLGTVTGTPLLAWGLGQADAPWVVLAFCLPVCVLGIVVHAWNARRRASPFVA